MSLRTVPILQGVSVVMLLVLTLKSYRDSCNGTLSSSNTLYEALWAILLLGLLGCVLTVPTALFARIVPYKGERFCTIDLNGVGGQAAVSVYYLLYSALLSYWVPLLVSFIILILNYKVIVIQGGKTIIFFQLFPDLYPPDAEASLKRL